MVEPLRKRTMTLNELQLRTLDVLRKAANQLPPTLTIQGRRPYLRDYGGGYLRIADTPGFDVKTEWLGGDGKWHCTLECPKPNQWTEAAALEHCYLHADLPEGFAIIKHREAGRDVCTLERRGANGLSSVSPLSVKDAYEVAWKAATQGTEQPCPDCDGTGGYQPAYVSGGEIIGPDACPKCNGSGVATQPQPAVTQECLVCGGTGIVKGLGGYAAWTEPCKACQPAKSQDAPPSGLDLPDGPGVWEHPDQPNFYAYIYRGVHGLEHRWILRDTFTTPITGDIAPLPRGGWRRAVAEGEDFDRQADAALRRDMLEASRRLKIKWGDGDAQFLNSLVLEIEELRQRAEAAEQQAAAIRSQLSGVQGALADAGDVLAQREDGDYGASVRQVVEKLTAAEAELAEARKERDRWRAACNNRVAADQIAALTKERDTLQFEFRDLARLLLTEGPGDPLAKEIAGWTVKQCTDRITAGWEAALERERVLRELVASAKGGIVYLANVALIDASARESWHEWNRKAIAALAQTAQPAEPGAQ